MSINASKCSNGYNNCMAIGIRYILMVRWLQIGNHMILRVIQVDRIGNRIIVIITVGLKEI